ncbi:MAG TPA: FAD-binding oxidoreductase, partial [Polyangiaceae bacterium]|nr:FAD-binding oxidoreductase [Polyangiaceae bacterium]
MPSTRSSGLVRLTGSVIAQKARSVLTPSEPTNVPRGDTRFVPPPPPAASPTEAMDGWGYADTRFEVQPDGSVTLTGNRYELSGQKLPALIPWMQKTLAAPLAYENKNEPHYPPAVPERRRSAELEAELAAVFEKDQLSDDPLVRLRHGHGHTGAEIWAVRYGKLDRVPDLVVYPSNHDQVVRLVETAARHRACIIPFGGGTNVTDALRLSPNEGRVVIAVNMRRMNRIQWIDPVNLTACIEAGAVGQYIADELGKYQLTMGHEPDSLEFSTLGGWIATNASGMKKNRYGNIEELVLDMSVVTADGVVGRPHIGPRESIGTNPKNLMFGSEGNYGIITSAIVKLFRKPELQRYGSVLFPTLGHGLDFLYELSRAGCVPASVRVMDNTQFHFGQALQPKASGMGAKFKSQVQKAVVTRLKGFDPHKLAIATVVFEGSREEVEFQEGVFYRIARTHGGMKAGAKNGERGYQLTF